jgi:GTP-sensing pleiotropic transcriptional regulator CodY
MSSGFEETEAEDSLTLYDALEDEAFEAIVAMYKKKMAKKAEVKENLPKDEKNESANPKAEVVASETETEVTEELFEEVNSTEATLVDASDVKDELEVTRASVAEWLTENVLRK